MQKTFWIALIAALALLNFTASAQVIKRKITDTTKLKTGGGVHPNDAPPDDPPGGGGGLTAAVDIMASATGVCAGSAVTYTAYHFFNQGLSPSFVWFVNGQNTGATGDTYTINSLTSNTSVYCYMLSSDPNVTNNPVQSNVVNSTVVPLVTPTVSVQASSTSACSGTSLTFTAVPGNQGNSPAYQWRVNGGDVSGAIGNTFTTSSLSNGQSVSVRMTSNVTCVATNPVTSAAIPITIISTPGVPSAPSGSTTLCQGGTATYTSSAPAATSYNWTITGGTVSGNGSSVTVSWPSALSGLASIMVSASNGCGTSGQAATAVNINPTVAPAVQPTGNTTLCQGSSGISYSTTAVAGATGYVWSVSPSGAGTVSSSGTTATVNWASSFSGVASVGVATTGCNASGTPATRSVNITPTVGTPSLPSGPTVISNGSPVVTYTTSASNASSYSWSIVPASAGMISGAGASATVLWNQEYVGQATVQVQAGGCNGPSTAVGSIVTVYASLKGGVIVPAYQTIATGNTPAELVCSFASGGNAGSYVYDWQSSADGAAWSSTGVSTRDYAPTPTVSTYYRRMVTRSGETAYSNAAIISVQASISNQDLNYIRTRTIQKPGVIDAATANGLTMPSDVQQTTVYFDGLGRPIQTVAKQATPQGHDLVMPQVYDPFGRDATHYLPFASSSPADGNFKPAALQEQQAFNASQFPGEQFHYGQTYFEPSPLNHAVLETAPGNSWTGNNRGVATAFEVNFIEDSVRLWSIANGPGSLPVNAGTYQAGTLYRAVTTDEHGHQVVEYKDLDGHVVLKKAQLAEVPGTAHVGWLCTYYVYDDLGNLRFVLQPRAVEVINTGSGNWSISQPVADELCFRYEYDARNRMIIKKVPGAAEVWMVYDQWDRLVMTHDGYGTWLYTKYDGLDRKIVIGQYSGPNGLGSQTAMQAYLNSQNNGRFETFIPGNSQFYTRNNTFPVLTSDQPFQYFFYDDYGFAGIYTFSGTKSNSYDNQFASPDNTAYPYPQALTQNMQVRGMLTGKYNGIIDVAPNPIKTVIYYDDRDRVIQTVQTNVTGGRDTTTNQYSFSGQLLQSRLNHQKSGNNPQTHVVTTWMSYDPAGRLLNISKSINSVVGGVSISKPMQILVTNTYNELGRLQEKNLGNLDNLVYDYNIRGWLTGINKNYIGNTGSIPLNYFGMELGYDKAAAAATTTTYKSLQYNGNISGTIWRSAGDGVDRKYDFSYDNTNRFLEAGFSQSSGAGFDLSGKINYNVGGLSYDANGNILSMNQDGFVIGGSVTVDSLVYTYMNGGASNKLQGVVDLANDQNSKLGDFHYNPTTKTSVDYVYNTTGTLQKDANKNITNSYNYLGQQAGMTGPGKGTIRFGHDAEGNKLAKQVNTVPLGGPAIVTWYIGPFIYLNDTLQSMAFEEGRARLARHSYTTGTSAYDWEYDFFERDHLGNTRVVLTQQKDTANYIATMEAAYRSKEMSLFYNIDSTSAPIPGGYPADNTTSPNDSVARVNGSGHKMGPALLLKVMSGDSLAIGVKSFYRSNGSPGSTNNSLPDVMNSLAQGLLSVAGPGHGTMASLNNTSGSPLYSALNSFLPANEADVAGTPKAYLNWMLLDNQFNYVSGGGQSGAQQVGAPDILGTMAQGVGIHHSGYLYIWVSNETKDLDVFFDNLSVSHYAGPMVEETHYYPFGLTMAGISDKALKGNYAENKYRFQKQELQNKEFNDGSGLELYEFKYRMDDPQIGRFWSVDPLASKYEYNSPYAFSENKVTTHVELEGLEAEYIFSKAKQDLANAFQGLANKVDNLVTYFTKSGSSTPTATTPGTVTSQGTTLTTTTKTNAGGNMSYIIAHNSNEGNPEPATKTTVTVSGDTKTEITTPAGTITNKISIDNNGVITNETGFKGKVTIDNVPVNVSGSVSTGTDNQTKVTGQASTGTTNTQAVGQVQYSTNGQQQGVAVGIGAQTKAGNTTFISLFGIKFSF